MQQAFKVIVDLGSTSPGMRNITSGLEIFGLRKSKMRWDLLRGFHDYGGVLEHAGGIR